MIVTLAGANGNLAVRILRCLLQKAGVVVRGYARNTAKIPEDIRNHSSFQTFQGEINDADKIRGVIRGADVVMCLYQGFDDVIVEGQKLLVDISEEEGVDRFFPSTFSGNIRNLKTGQHERMDLTLQIMEYLETKKLRPVHILIGGFLETWLGYLGIVDHQTNTVSYWGTGNEVWELTSYDDTAAFTAEVVMDKSAVGDMKFVGDRITPLEFAKVYERRFGINPKLVNYGSLDDLYKKMHEERDKHRGDSPWHYLPLFYQYYTSNGTMLLNEPVDNARYPNLRPTTVEEFIQSRDLSDPHSLQRPL
ncbi:hypothetical protein FZEAL_6897 [Fusarium zealandicum]|uniref:NmrA-like domain-containing protein n=1 Tax=Fusarium zealandicum TaxID=1053134 RepID=A0A8H4UHU4_9HYPO|nr:hypothetical protein FZEAL_6897 [Fusarium zealandicum]